MKRSRASLRRADSVAKRSFGNIRFADVCFVFQIAIRGTARETTHFVTGRLEPFDFAADKRMADRRIDVAKIG